MSAFVVSRNHINYLVQCAISRKILAGSNAFRWYWQGMTSELHPGDNARATEVGQMLWDENIKSVHHRYPQDTLDNLPGPIGETYTFEFHYDHYKTIVDPVQVIKACDCLNYQSCEHPEWEQSEAKEFIDTLRSHAWHELPGYDEAKWDID